MNPLVSKLGVAPILLLLAVVIAMMASPPHLLFAAEAGADSPQSEVAALREEVARLTALVASLSTRLARLEEEHSTRQALVDARLAEARAMAAPARGGVIQNQNPDISVVGVAVGKASTDRRDPDRNAIRLEGSELVLTKNVSPYARANLTLGYHGEEGHVEEGYADFSHVLPGRWEARVGRFLMPIGTLNQIHSHDWPMAARPLPLEFFLGGEHGATDEGLSLSTPLDLRSKTYARWQAEALRGGSTILFNDGQTRVLGGRLSGNTPLNDRDDLNWGMNWHRGAWNRAGDLDSTVYGGDLMWRRRLSQFDRLTFWGEWLWNTREALGRSPLTAKGYYLTGMYKFRKDRDWHIGVEYDCTERPGDARFNAVARSAFAGYWFTENDRLQLQFRQVRDPFRGASYNEVLLQVIWGMGPHKPHLANF